MESNKKSTLCIWDKLVELALHDQIITYKELADELGLGPAIGVGRQLDPLYYFCRSNSAKIPMLTDLVVNKATGLPSNRDDFSEKDFKKSCQDIFAYDWQPNLKYELEAFLKN